MSNYFHQIYRMILCLLGIIIIILDIIYFDKNWALASIGGLIILVSGVQIHILIYQKDNSPEEIVSAIKHLVKEGTRR